MAEQIKDGQGRGFLAGVTSENRLKISGVAQAQGYYANAENTEAYHLVFSQTPTDAADCFLYMKNSSDTDIVVEGIWFRVASAEAVSVKLGDTGTASGTTATPVNCNAGSANEASGTFKTGNDITGLSGGTVVEKYWLTSTASLFLSFAQGIVLPKNATLTLWATTGAVAVAGTVVFNYYSED